MSSPNGTQLIGVAGSIYASSDAGLTWYLAAIPDSTNNAFYGFASVPGGSDFPLTAIVVCGSIYASNDSGQTYAQIYDVDPAWSYWWTASSSDGNKLVSTSPGNGIVTAFPACVHHHSPSWGP